MIHDFDKSSIEMIDWSCARCGCVQWMPKELDDQFRNNHKTFYCINGCGNLYKKKTDIEEIEGKLMNEYSRNAQLETEIVKLKKKISLLQLPFYKRYFK